MARVITQDTFNDVVLENMELFDMSEAEAVDEATKQLEAQGVNLTCIMKNPKKASKIKEKVHKLADLLEQISSTEEVVKVCLGCLTELTKDDLPGKLLAANEGLYPSLKTCLKAGSDVIKQNTLETLTSLMDGNPDLLDEEGMSLLLQSLNPSLPPKNIAFALCWMVSCVKKHESTRAALIRAKVSAKLKEIAAQHESEEEVISGVCSAISVLLLDDDIRVIHGDAHEHARALATDLLPLLIQLLPKFISDEDVAGNLLQTITSLLVRNEYCIAFHEEGGLKYAFDLAVEHPDNEKVAREWFLLLKALAGSDEVREPIIAAGAASLIVSAFEKHYKSCNVAVAACMCLAALTLRSPSNSTALAAVGLPEILVRCMNKWKKNQNIMRHGCTAIRNQVSRCPELRAEYFELQVEELLRLLKDEAGNIEFEAKSVLQLLGCMVEFKEEWRGQGNQLSN